MEAKIPLDCFCIFGMLKFTLLHQFHTVSRISSKTKVNLQCVATIPASFVGFGLTCWILVYITKRRSNDGSYSSNSYGPYGGYYGGVIQSATDTIRYNDDMIDGVVIPGLLAVQALLLIGE